MKVVRETCSRYDTTEYLETKADIAAYVAACAEEAPNDPAFMLWALGAIARARNVSELVEATGTRAGPCNALSDEGNPSLANTMKVAKALGYRASPVPCCSWLRRRSSSR